jgi:hypothetical protein
MTLAELSPQYVHAGDLLRRRLRQLRAAERRETDADARWHLERRIALLSQMLREVNELADLTAHYYEGSYYRNGKYTL